ncbi:MAG: glutathione synthase [Ruminococcus sp.]|nr:glutathione synthase [Ruminococcus sp.]
MAEQLLYEGSYGLERETLRVDSEGRLAQTPHPFGSDENMTRDFCENQIELITPVCKSISEVLESLGELDRRTREKLRENGESIWLYSNPPHFEDEGDIPVANFTGEFSGKRLYREQLERRYGKRLMLFSGIHFNFSFSDRYLRKVCPGDNFGQERDMFYLRLYKQLTVHSFLPLALSAASPVYDRSLDKDHESGRVLSKYGSIRSGERGYWNEFIPELRHDDLSSFVDSIQYYVDKGVLFSASELYLPVRLKPRGVNTLDNLRNGVSHVELRMFDLDPLQPLGIDPEVLEFTHLMIMYLSTKPDFDLTPELQKQAVLAHRSAALYDLTEAEVYGEPLLRRAEAVMDEMAEFFREDEKALGIIEDERKKLYDRPCFKAAETDIYR